MPTMSDISTPSRSAMTSALMSAADTLFSASRTRLRPFPCVLSDPNKFRLSRSTIEERMTTSSPASEEYIQAIYTLQDEGSQVIGARLADFLQVSPAAVSEMLHRLERDGLVLLDDRRSVRLAPSGQQLAELITRRHRLAERMLVDLLGYA